MSTPSVPRDLLLPPSQRVQPAFREQRKQKLKEQLLKRKTCFAFKQENKISSSRDQRVMTCDGQVQEEMKVLKRETKMGDKENVSRSTKSKHNVTMEKNCIPLKPFNELTTSSIAVNTHNLENNNQTLQLLPNKHEHESQRMTLSQTFHMKNNNKKKQTTTEIPKQGTNTLKKPVLGSYRGHIVQSKVNSFRKPVQVQEESSAITKKLSTATSKGTKPQPINTSSVKVKSDGASNMMTNTKFVSTASRNRHLLHPPVRSLHNNGQDFVKRGNSRTSTNVTIQKGPRQKELLQLNSVLSSIKTSSSQEVKTSKTLSRSITSEIIARPASSSNTKLIEKSKTIDQRRHTIAKVTIDNRSVRSKETAEERKARLNEWRAGKGRVLKRPSSVVTQPKPERQSAKPVGSFWTTMAEEDEQRLFTEKVNKIVSGCLNLVNEGCPKEEILDKLNDLIKVIPDAKKLVKYWICLARIEALTSPIENIIAIYEKAILAGAQPIEEMRHTIVDILTLKSQEKIKFGENFEEACATKEEIKEVNIEDAGVNLETEKPEMENKHHRNMVFQDCEEEQDDKTKDLANDVKTPSTETSESCLIKCNVSTTPYLQSVKKFDEINSTFKELKFLTPVRRSRRLQDKTSKLPEMLKDHYPCVSSFHQLTELEDGTDTFIYRPNAALLVGMFMETETTEKQSCDKE